MVMVSLPEKIRLPTQARTEAKVGEPCLGLAPATLPPPKVGADREGSRPLHSHDKDDRTAGAYPAATARGQKQEIPAE